MPRRRIGDGPSPCLLGEILLALIRHGHDATADGWLGSMTAAGLADVLQRLPAQARTAAAELVRARCLRVGRAPTARRGDSGRYAQAFRLAPPGEERGAARHPRICPVALLIEPDVTRATRLGSTLREIGVLPIAVSSGEEALTLLAHLGFELVLADTTLPQTVAAGEAARLRQATRHAGCGPLVAITDVAGGAVVSEIETLAVPLTPYNPVVLRAVLAEMQGTDVLSPAPQHAPALAGDSFGSLAASFNAP